MHVLLAQDARDGVESPEQRQATGVAVGRHGAEELVADPAAVGAEHAAQLRQLLSLADEDRAPAHARKLEDVARQDVVARAEHADEERRQDERRRRQPVGRVVVARSESEGERDHGHEHQGEHDLAETGAQLTPSVQPADPEHEHGDHRQEGQPVALGAPQDPPEGRPLAEVELAEDQGDVDAQHEPSQVEQDQSRHAREPAGDRDEAGAREEVRPRGADVLHGRRTLLFRRRRDGTRSWLRAHRRKCTSGLF